ncbi:MAG: hypothetical protein AAF530_18710 [Pseudomonadota bacterium]
MESTWPSGKCDAVRSIGEILRDDFNWQDAAFVDGMAPLDFQNGQQVWKPRNRMLMRFFGATNGRPVKLQDIIRPGCKLKFRASEVTENATKDFQHWRGFFDREAVYSDESFGFVLDRWVRFGSFNTRGFDFSAEYLNHPVVVTLPTIVFFGADWIQYKPAGQNPWG